jgi:diguanylate cyclase (GGDEF)-like protein/PAS domain S-box-containing protein
MIAMPHKNVIAWSALAVLVGALFLGFFAALWLLQSAVGIDFLRIDRAHLIIQAICLLLAFGVVCSLVRVRAEYRARKKAETSLRWAARAFEQSFNAIMILRGRDVVVEINPAYTDITGYSRDEVVGKQPIVMLCEESATALQCKLERGALDHCDWELEVQARRKCGERFDCVMTVSYIRDLIDDAGEPYALIVFADVTAARKQTQQLERIAHFDVLTGLPNRLLLSQLLEQGIAQRVGDDCLAVCYLDLDNLQSINDEYSHEIGDYVLLEMASRLQKAVRPNDVVAHVGGDEFVLMLCELPSADECYVLLDDVLTAMREPVAVAGFTFKLSIGIGVTIYPHDLSGADRLVRHANMAMQQAKERGKNRIHLFNTDRARDARLRRSMLMRLREALDNNEFALYYQPKVDLHDGHLIGAEALIRWIHPEQGLLAPGMFLPFLEGSELELDIGEWVIEAALQQMESWLQADDRCVPVSVNISAQHLLHPEFSARLQRALLRHPDVPEYSLELEILETAALNDLGVAVATITACKKMGVKFSLDDFGTGYSSLSYFRQLPVDILKIDQSFVRNMHENSADLEIVESVIKLARVLDRSVIAEGVETDQHAELLRRIGCQFGQGYGIAKPMPSIQLLEWARRREQPRRAESCPQRNSWPDAHCAY